MEDSDQYSLHRLECVIGIGLDRQPNYKQDGHLGFSGCDPTGKVRNQTPVKMFERNWMRMRSAACNELKLPSNCETET